ncbi:hypothetical protein CXF83_02465 [Shewanella sp. Choline-02u-19]|uniref:Ig-like domain-containing protein n=1 Tax=unclassified Shewanella TaxID=196818 RepID=UPI000C33D12E|nr:MULTISPECIES: Ig-like domain-containing protein [unclassified Shewanella]PKH58199.1 hypothetical protein CXF84_06070 [Shewanella sp. Bg11-22]PKI29538.1 hypothetical protein CXF83_02465 [Shewanella sp. Choline-02u-19]
MPSIYRILIPTIFVFILAACGGDGDGEPVCPSNVPCGLLDNSDAAPTSDDAITYNVSLSIIGTGGDEVSSITAVAPGKLVAAVDGISDPVIVTFSSSLGDLPITTAVTDENGNATVDILAGTTLGAGTVTASLVTGEQDTAILVIGATNLVMGSGEPLQEGIAEVSTDSLSAGGTASISVMIVDEQGMPFTQPADVYFSSACAKASTPLAELTSPVTAINGLATSLYLATGCIGNDPISITVNVGGSSLSASASINILAPTEGSISFVSAEPSLISIKTTGGLETSVVKFQVFDTTGTPVSNKTVSFSLNTEMGGTYLSHSQGITDSSGMVQTVVNSGAVATTVRVMATVDASDPLLITQSSKLIISTGIPDQDSFTLKVKNLNPDLFERVPVTAYLADAFNNFAPDGTAVYFTTEGGAIDDSCFTLDGQCTVEWQEQNPRPVNGRSTVTAYALGEESFPDSNGNGRFDADEFPLFQSVGIDSNQYDMNEVFNDYNENKVYDKDALEELIDFNNDGTFTRRDKLYNGVLCSVPVHDGCADGLSDSKSIHIRGSVVIVMSGSSAVAANVVVIDSGIDNDDQVLDISGADVGQASLTITDSNGQQMPSGSVVTFTSSVGEVVGQSSFTWPNTNEAGGQSYGIAVKGTSQAITGELVVMVKTPNGHESTAAIIPINITP